MVNEKKESLVSNWIEKIRDNTNEATRKSIVSKEMQNIHKVTKDWVMAITMRSWCKLLAEKCILKEIVMKRTNKLMRIMFITMQVVGKFCRMAYFIKKRKLMRLMTNYVCLKVYIWRKKKAHRIRKIIANFFCQYSNVS